MLLTLALLALCPTHAAHRQSVEFEKITEDRVRAAYAEARAALETEVGAQFDEGLTLRLATAADAAERVAEENLPQVRRRQPDEEKAKAEAKVLGDALGSMLLAKYAWSTHEFLVVPQTWELNARELAQPRLTADATLRAMLVHELVHAWDDKVYGLAAFMGRSDSIDATNAISAIVEGHAQHVARRVCKVRGWSAGFDTCIGVIGAIPESSKKLGQAMLAYLRIQATSVSFQYHDGERFVAALEAAGGADALARAFRDPPRDGETILHPDWFLDPKLRPATLYDPEPALDLFVARFPGDIWTSQRQSVQSNQIEAGFALAPKEESRPVLVSIRNARAVSLQPTANPAEKLVGLTILEFGTAAEARAFIDLSDRLSKLKDEQQKTGLLRITDSTTSTIESVDVFGLLHSKQMKIRKLAFGLNSIDLARGILVVETVFSGEPIEVEAHTKLALEMLDAVKKREVK